MTIAPAPPAAEVPARRSRRRKLLVALTIAVLVVTGGTIVTVKMAFRYAHAAPLACACGVAWAADEHARDVYVGAKDSLVATARPGHAQTFYVLVDNPSPVTQTILGPQSYDRDSAEPIDFAVARPTTSALLDQGESGTQRYTTKPVSLAPGGIRWIRYTIHTSADGLWSRSRSEFWTELDLRVRVGAFTRIERVPLDSQLVLAGH